MPEVDAQLFVFSELEQLYPAPESADNVRAADQGLVPADNVRAAKSDDGQIQGLGTLPGDWPELPANASLSADVGWVQANRLRMIEEQAGGATVVHLERAASPAPSWSALAMA